MIDSIYLMENEEETLRLELKTDTKVIESQANWAGIQKGMRVADIGCGPGKTTFSLNAMVQPGGSALGLDISEKRIAYARKHYRHDQINFVCEDIRRPLTNLGKFDFVWLRFILEYFRKSSFEIVKNISEILKPGGVFCIIDLDHNCMSHYGFPPKIENTIQLIMHALEEKADFDPYVGRKLYSFLYDLGYEEIDVRLDPHHLIFGHANEVDLFNWLKKVEIVSNHSIYPFDEYRNGHKEFCQKFKRCFEDPRRFLYTPMICCRGKKPH
jgi:ubiquinone/menaquinone biosynthesis C-methylase UbiE